MNTSKEKSIKKPKRVLSEKQKESLRLGRLKLCQKLTAGKCNIINEEIQKNIQEKKPMKRGKKLEEYSEEELKAYNEKLIKVKEINNKRMEKKELKKELKKASKNKPTANEDKKEENVVEKIDNLMNQLAGRFKAKMNASKKK